MTRWFYRIWQLGLGSLLGFSMAQVAQAQIIPGADQPERYLRLFQNKRVALIANPTSQVGSQHLLDFLLKKNVKVTKVFAPEHGFRGEAEAGATIANGRDSRTQLPVESLYGEHKQPAAAALSDVDLMVFDIQDVGVRFYTFISTLHYVMESCAQTGKPLLVLDRPNPNGGYIDGPILEPAWRSFVGMHPIPLLHGLTVGELAHMINGEKWLTHGKCALSVIPVAHYRHGAKYAPPIPPSPNLPNLQAIQLYPSLGLFEGTSVSVGRGTPFPFQLLGAPDQSLRSYAFMPIRIPGKAQHPMHENQLCYGQDLSQVMPNGLTLAYLIDFYAHSSQKTQFFNPFFDKLAGTQHLRQAIVAGQSETQIRSSWATGLAHYKHLRKRYLLYAD